jgi:hypothetical protein
MGLREKALGSELHENGAGPIRIARCVSRDFSTSYDHLARRRVQDGWEDCFV